jgi:hypothetical protein
MASWPLPKDPDAVLDYQFDWSLYLQPGETIETSVFIPLGSASLELFDQPELADPIAGAITTFWARGGEVGEVVKITNRITTNQGRTDDDTATLRIRGR